VDTTRIFTAMEAAAGDQVREALTMLGLRSMRGVVGHLRFAGDGFDAKTELLLLVGGQRAGLAKILSMRNRPVTPPSSIPADALVYAGLNVNVLEILDELERMIRRDDPAAADDMRAGLDAVDLPDGGTLRFRQDVLENLRPPLTFTMGFQRPYGPESIDIRLMIGHRSRSAMAGFLEKLSTIAPVPMIEREVDGTLAYDFAYGGFSLAPTEDTLIAGTTNAVETALHHPVATDSLATTPAFRKAAALVPPEAWCVIYVDSPRIFEAALEMAAHKAELRASQFANPASIIALQIAENFSKGIDPDQIDAARQLARYQTPSILTIATTPAGVHLTQIHLASQRN